MKKHDDLSHLSMLDLYRVETETQTAVLTKGLLDLERGDASPRLLETLMRAAHSLKGAARIVNLPLAVRIAHALEDCFVAAQSGAVRLKKSDMDLLLHAIDVLQIISHHPEKEMAAWESEHEPEVEKLLRRIAEVVAGNAGNAASPRKVSDPAKEYSPSESPAAPEISSPKALETAAEAKTTLPEKVEDPQRVLRLTAESLNRLLGLAGESLVESRWLTPFGQSMRRMKRLHADLKQSIDALRQSLAEMGVHEHVEAQMTDVFVKLADCREFFGARLEELEMFDYRSAQLSHRLYLEVLQSRMRPFGDSAQRFPRMVRDLARALGKEAKLEILGDKTQVDRDILERLETPLAHLLRNAVDHGCETPEERERQGKPREGTIRLEARHSAGMLQITVTDDGAGLFLERIRETIIHKQLITPAVAQKLSDAELIEFLFLPGFTLKETVTEISGRGVGLDIVQSMVKSVRGTIRAQTFPGKGMRFQLQLPLTLSVLRTLLVEIAGEAYAIPLAQIVHTLKIPQEQIQSLEGRPHFTYKKQPVGLVTAHQVLDVGDPSVSDVFSVVVLGDKSAMYGLVVDRFIQERELVVQQLDPRLGKVKDINAAALMEDGSPVLILDVEDVIRSIEKLVSEGSLARVNRDALTLAPKRRKRILAVDDSLTVRELERKILSSRGYIADVAVDGMDGWNAVRTGSYDLVITDVDMPRLDGIELAMMIKKDPQLKSLPVMIVSYKDREEDRLRGLEAGADYYLTKGSFQDDTLIQAVTDLIGEPEA